MRISKLRRTLAVFLSALMITLCVPFSGITASAVNTIDSVTLNYSGTSLPTTPLIAGDRCDVDTLVSNFSVGNCKKGDSYVVDGNETHFKGNCTYAANTGYYVCITVLPEGSNKFTTDTSVIAGTSLQGRNITFTCLDNGYQGLIRLYLGFAYAQRPEYTITFDANGGVSCSTTSVTGLSSTSYQIPTDATPTRDDFNFLGWANSPYETTAQYSAGQTITLSSLSTTLYAVWEHSNHDWSYSVSGGNVITAKCSETACKYNKKSTRPKLTLNADSVDYTGSPYTGASVSADSGFPVTVTNSDIKYKSYDGTTYPESTTAPTNAGLYNAFVTAGGKTASKLFSINAITMTGISAANVTKTYDGNAYGIEVKGVPDGAVVKYGVPSEGFTLSESPKYTNVGTYDIIYKVTKENYEDYTGSASLTINRAEYTGEKTAEKEILAGEVNTDLTVALPEIPDNMSYCTPAFNSPVTAASITDGVLTFSTGNNTRDADKYNIKVYVEGTNANYFDYDITVTLTANACSHTNVETEWTYDDDGHWHKCPDCTSKRDYAAHSFTDYVYDGNADCLNDGTKTAVCDQEGCNATHTVTDTGTAPGHDWSEEFTHDDTHHWHECVRDNCPGIADNSDKDGYEEHTTAAAVEENRVEPTCTEDGSYDEVVYCSVCKCELSRTKRTLDKTGHSFTDYVSDGNADCLNDGTKTAKCDHSCGETDTVTDVGSATGHAWSDDYTYDTHYHWHECEHTNCPVTDNADKDGYAAHISSGEATEDNDEHCTVCGYVINPPLDHLCGRTELTFVPEVPETCTTDGTKAHYECRCGKLYSDKNAAVEVTAADLRIPAHHVWSESWSNDETQHYHLCTVCGEKNDTAAHTFADIEVITEPTEDSEGLKRVGCTVCGYEKNVTIPKLDHVHSYSTQKHDSEYHWNECRCGEISDKALHTFGDWIITKLATSTADGTKERSCSVCGYVQTDVVNYIPDDNDEDTGDINNTTDPDENACHSDVELTKPEIIEKIELTPEELTAVENGEDINVYLEVVDNTANVSESDKDLTESVLGSDDTVAMYLDINLFKQVGQNSPTKVTNTNGDITIVLEIPESLINTDSSIERTYSIVRVHDGAADNINGVFDAASRKFKFVTDKFSSYAIAYTDTATTDSDPNPNPNPNPNPSPAPSSHTHSYKLKYDETGHWEQCSCGDKKDFEEHKFGEWEVVQEPTNEKEGLEKHTCTICGYSETVSIISVESGVGVTAEEDSIDMTSKKAAFFIPVIAIATLGAVAFVLRRKARK